MQSGEKRYAAELNSYVTIQPHLALAQTSFPPPEISMHLCQVYYLYTTSSEPFSSHDPIL